MDDRSGKVERARTGNNGMGNGILFVSPIMLTASGAEVM
jgi:hypothetical protein